MAGLEGSTLDRYELRKLVGKGGMAEVYLGYDHKFQRVVAVKVFKRSDEEMLRRFIREARLMASLRHPHLVPVYDAGEYVLDGYTQYYIVMPFMEGGTLRARIKQSPLTSVEACRYLSDIADALDYVHTKGIIHRDIKSSNVLLDKEGICYLSDFGIARATSDATHLTSTGNVLGTVDYVAPELFEVNRRADSLSDLYSLGVLLYEMVTGQLPFSAENQIALVSMHMNQPPPPPSKLSRNISPGVERVIYRSLAKKPELRYPTATGLAQAFCQAASAPAEAAIPPARVSSGAIWEYSPSGPNLGDSGQRGPLILPPPVTPASAPQHVRQMPNTPAPPVVPVQAASRPDRPPLANQQQPTMYPNLAQPPAQAASPRSRRGLLLGIAALVVLLLVAVPLVIAFNHYTPFGGNASPTQTAASGTSAGSTVTAGTTATPDLTATAQINATAGAIASATAVSANQTATAAANASATPGVFGTALANPAANTYNDPLTNKNNPATKAAKWDTGGSCGFASDGYHARAGHNAIGGGQFTSCHETGKQYGDVAIAVNMRIMSGLAGGLYFRIDSGSNCCNGYLFEVDSLGNYKISASRPGDTTALQNWTSSSALHQGQQSNTLQVLARGTTLFFYVNNTFLQAITDQTFDRGYIGFSADSKDNAPDTDVVYTNLQVSPQASA